MYYASYNMPLNRRRNRLKDGILAIKPSGGGKGREGTSKKKQVSVRRGGAEGSTVSAKQMDVIERGIELGTWNGNDWEDTE